VIKLKVQVGGTVLIIEAMKMENEVHTPISGEVKEIRVKEGDAWTDEALVIVR
jgi:biotin carboxyl carrier protein